MANVTRWESVALYVRQRHVRIVGLAEMLPTIRSADAYVMPSRCSAGDDCPGGGSHEGQGVQR